MITQLRERQALISVVLGHVFDVSLVCHVMKLVVKLRMLSKSAVLVERCRRSHRWWRSARQTLETRLNLHQLRNVRPEKLLLGQCMDFCRGRRGNRGGLCELRGISCSCFRSMAPVIVVVFWNDILTRSVSKAVNEVPFRIKRHATR